MATSERSKLLGSLLPGGLGNKTQELTTFGFSLKWEGQLEVRHEKNVKSRLRKPQHNCQRGHDTVGRGDSKTLGRKKREDKAV